MYSLDYSSPFRARILGRSHMAAAGHYLAAAAANQILLAGGNAVDAGVAGGIALGVVESVDVGFAGVAPTLIRLGDTGKVVCVAGVGVWPKSITSEALRARSGDRVPEGILQTVVPAAPSAWIRALQRFGTMRFAEVAAPAISFARDGFPMHRMMADIVRLQKPVYDQYPSSSAVYMPNGVFPEEGDIFVQRDLAAVLQHMADNETEDSKLSREDGLERAHAAFYRGDIAEKIARFQAENGGFLTREDLAEFSAPIENPVMATFNGAEVYTSDAWGQGPAMTMALKILEQADLRAMEHNGPDYIHTVIEAIKLANADRYYNFRDPAFVASSLDRLLSADYNRERLGQIDLRDASLQVLAGLKSHGDFSLDRYPEEPLNPAAATSVIATADKQGNAFISTPSEGAGNSCLVPGLGFAISRRGRGCVTVKGHPAEPKPGHRPRMTNGAVFVSKPGQWIMPIASPGSDNQMQAVLQSLLNILVFDMPLQQAVESPRATTHAFPGTFEPHNKVGSLFLEGRFPDKVGAELRRRGHKVTWWGDWGPQVDHTDISTVCAVRAKIDGSAFEGAADPRRPSGVLGL